MTREELKEHCEKQIEMCEAWAMVKAEEPGGKIYEEHKLILELLKQEPRWIPVSERLPKDRREVLVTAYWHETYQVMMGSYFGDGLWWCVPFNNCGEHMQRLEPKAWMPLPTKPYKVESEPQKNDIEKRKPCINYEDGCEEWAGCPCVHYKAESEDQEMTREDRKLSIEYLEGIKNNYIEGHGYERYPLPEYYAIENAIKTLEQESALDKLRAEIEQLKHQNTDVSGYRWWNNAIDNCLHEIDALKAEIEG